MFDGIAEHDAILFFFFNEITYFCYCFFLMYLVYTNLFQVDCLQVL